MPSFVSIVGSPWGSRQPEPFYDKQTVIYHVSLVPGARSPFQPADGAQLAGQPDLAGEHRAGGDRLVAQG